MESDGRVRSVTATAGHPFWVAEAGRFVNAGDLVAGESLRSATGAVLVHNCTGGVDHRGNPCDCKIAADTIAAG